MGRKKQTHRQIEARSRGTVYVLVLGASLLVAAIGISALMAARVQHKATQASANFTQARLHAQSAVDGVLLRASVSPAGEWRLDLENNALVEVPFGGGTMSVVGRDPIDGSLTNNNIDPVILRGIGKMGQARYMLEVTLNGDGTVVPGTWRRVVN